MVYLHSGILHGSKKKEEEETLTFFDSMGGPGDYYAKWNKSVSERQIPYNLTYM